MGEDNVQRGDFCVLEYNTVVGRNVAVSLGLPNVDFADDVHFLVLNVEREREETEDEETMGPEPKLKPKPKPGPGPGLGPETILTRGKWFIGDNNSSRDLLIYLSLWGLDK